MRLHTVDELEAMLGDGLRALRLQRNLPQEVLAERSGISMTALKNLEGGKGATIKTLVSVLRVLGREEWINSLAPVVSISPLNMVKNKPVRERASPRRSRSGNEKK